MIKILLMIIMCKNVIGDIEESNEKYIDLLPEEEKQEFLNRIARRILDEIKSKDTPNESHADITDDQLDAHDAFVQEILKQESDNFKNEKRQIENQEGNENDRIKRNDITPNEHDRIDSNTGDKEDHIDLTLREGKIQERKNSDSEFGKETTTEMFYDVIPVKTIYNQFENDDNKVEVLQVGNSTNKGEGNTSTLEKEQERNVNDEGNVNIISEIGNSSDSILPNNVLINDSIHASDKNENIDNLRKSFHNKFKLGTTEMVDFEPNSNENSATASNINDDETTPLPTIVSEEVTESTLNDENIWVSTQKIYDEDNEKTREEQTEETKTVLNRTSNVLPDTITETMTTILTDFIETSKNKSTNTEINDVTNSDSHNISKNIFLRSDSNEHKDIKTERSIIEAVKLAAESNVESETISLSTIDNTLLSQSGNEVTTENQLQTKAVENLSVAESVFNKNNNLEILTHVENGYKENLGVTESVNILKSEDREDVKNVEQNTKREKLENNENILRARLDSFDASQIDGNEYVQNSGDDSNKMKVYEVFEVDENQPHFIAAGKVQQNEHPLYVPVYNYAPENAYYRPYNKFGPNIEDPAGPKSFEIVDSKPFNLQNARNSFSGYSNNKIRDGFDKNKRNSKQSYLKLVTKKQRPKNKFVNQVTQNVNNQAIHYNPDDYADLDYYFSRILRRRQKYNSANKNNYENYFPDSNEYDHPLSVMHKSDTIKDHVRAVRNILYLQKQFGYVPQANEKAFRKTNQHIRKGGSRKPRKKFKISVDYYFDRADEVDNNKEIFRLHKSKLKHNINSNIVPLTPKPFNSERDLENIHEIQELQVDNNSESINREINNVPFKKLFEAMIVVLKDSIEVRNENLVKYDWLKTTVNIQAAMRKLLDLIEQLKSGKYVHPKDIELLKYTIYLFKSSKLSIKGAAMKENIIKGTKTLRAKKIENSTEIEKITKIKIPINLWKKSASLRRRKGFELKEQAFNLLSDLEDVLHKLLFYLNDLHDTIKHISIVTEYKNQNWLEDLKALYLQKGSKKNLAKVILHLSLSRLLDSIEDSSMHGVEDNFRIFVEKNRETIQKSREESLFLLNVLNELSRLN